MPDNGVPTPAYNNYQRFIENYLSNVSEDPSGVEYNFIQARNGTYQTFSALMEVPHLDPETWELSYVTEDALGDNHTIILIANASCGTEGTTKYISGKRKFAVMIKLERNGYYCIDN